jgi:hypothetical protein
VAIEPAPDLLPAAIASLPVGPRPEFGLSLDRALALASEGRVVIRVRSLIDESRALQLVGKHGFRTPGFDPGLRIALGAHASPPGALSPTIQPSAPVVASDGQPSAFRSPQPVASPASAPTWRLLETTFAAPFAPTKAALRKLLADLRQGQFTVELIEVPAFAAATSTTRPTEADPDALLWWTRAATWNPPLSIPVVIEVR